MHFLPALALKQNRMNSLGCFRLFIQVYPDKLIDKPLKHPLDAIALSNICSLCRLIA